MTAFADVDGLLQPALIVEALPTTCTLLPPMAIGRIENKGLSADLWWPTP
ncbi:hypothetical protein JOD47_002104 [Arthrobacter tumbae]|nr:hypothetical protein [Arthrobacter tumbae]